VDRDIGRSSHCRRVADCDVWLFGRSRYRQVSVSTGSRQIQLWQRRILWRPTIVCYFTVPSQLEDTFTTAKEELNSPEQMINSKKEFFKTVVSLPGMTPDKAMSIWMNLFSDEWARGPELLRAMGVTPKSQAVSIDKTEPTTEDKK
jgi:hypothetical protein